MGTFPTAWYLDAELHQCTRHWETLKDEFLGTFGLVGRTEVLGIVLREIDNVAWGGSHLYISLEVSTWEM